MVGEGLQNAVDAATDNALFEVAARAGHVTSGLLHILIAYVIARVAAGGGGAADQSGALAAVAQATGGVIALWAGAIALLTMALWRVAEVIVGAHATERGSGDGPMAMFDRAKAFGLALVYAAFGYSTLRFAMGAGESSGRENVGLSARLMQSGVGATLLVAVGVITVAIGAYHVHKGVRRSFHDDLNCGANGVVDLLGVTGYVAKGVVVAGAGVLVVVATVRSDPAQASGLDAAVKSLVGVPGGRELIAFAALGFAVYGVYSFVMARHARM